MPHSAIVSILHRLLAECPGLMALHCACQFRAYCEKPTPSWKGCAMQQTTSMPFSGNSTGRNLGQPVVCLGVPVDCTASKTRADISTGCACITSKHAVRASTLAAAVAVKAQHGHACKATTYVVELAVSRPGQVTTCMMLSYVATLEDRLLVRVVPSNICMGNTCPAPGMCPQRPSGSGISWISLNSIQAVPGLV